MTIGGLPFPTIRCCCVLKALVSHSPPVPLSCLPTPNLFQSSQIFYSTVLSLCLGEVISRIVSSSSHTISKESSCFLVFSCFCLICGLPCATQSTPSSVAINKLKSFVYVHELSGYVQAIQVGPKLQYFTWLKSVV